MELEFNLKKLLWSVLLSMGEPVSAKKFQEFIHRSFPDRFMALSELKLAVEEMNAKLAGDGAPEEIAEGPEGYYIRLTPAFAEAVRAYKGEPKPQKMTAAAMETLSIIAYRQPITRAQMEAIRGVNCDSPVQKLVELELIEGRQNEELPGRPFVFSTTGKFLQMCGIKSLSELPQSEAGEDERLKEFFKKAEAGQTQTEIITTQAPVETTEDQAKA
jgi:segregation and condensation protein B